jgi:hypothetical protein
MPMADKSCCTECGLLAVRNADDSSIYPADERLRSNGELPVRELPGTREPWHGASILRRPDTLICYLGRKELPYVAPGQNCVAAICSEHDCPRAIKWIPGRTAEQHLAMYEIQEQRVHNEKMLKEEREWRDQQAKSDRDWRDADRKARDKEASEVERRHQRDSESAERRFRWTLGVAIVGILLGQILIPYLRPDPTPAPAPVANVPPAQPTINVTVPPIQIIAQPAAAAKPVPDPDPTPTGD